MCTDTSSLYLWLPIIIAAAIIVVVCLVTNSAATKASAKSKPRKNERSDGKPSAQSEPSIAATKPPKPSFAAMMKVYYVRLDDSQYPPLLSLQGDLVSGSLHTGDFVRNIDSSLSFRINCMSDYGNHIADTINVQKDCVILIETDDQNYIVPGDVLVKD